MKVRSSGISEIEHSVTGEKLTLLAVFAHPEDEAFGPSGTLARYAGEGVRVSLVTAARDLALLNARLTDSSVAMLGGAVLPRDKTCSCRAAGIHRVCLDDVPAQLQVLRSEVLEERLVRLIREVQAQVIVTYGPNGMSGDSEQMLVHRLATRAFELAGDPRMFPQHAQDNLYAYQPQKLYYSVLPNSLINRWGLSGLQGVPDEQITTVLDVSPYSELKLKAVYCQRHHVLDYTRWLELNRGLEWNEEHFVLAASNLGRRTRKEKDLFAGLR
ncbi:MAG TPA: PIG-L family deacetylase [Anaerolineae bacterium]|nr:PIG-L family deacetylase [Anaerolineae bacterium]